WDVSLVDAVLQRIKVVAKPDVRADLEHPFAFQLRVARKGRCSTLAKVSEDKPQIVPRGVTSNSDFAGEALIFRRLLHALPSAIVFPTMIKTADALLLNPTKRELRPTMGTPEVDDVRVPAFAPIKGKLFAHDLNRNRMARLELISHIDRMPKHSHVSPRQSTRAGMDKIRVVGHFDWLIRCNHHQTSSFSFKP